MVLCSMIGEIIDYTSSDDIVISRMEEIIENLRDEYANDLRVAVLSKDSGEFNILLIRPKFIIDIIRYIKMEMHPIQLRFGIGFERNTNTFTFKSAKNSIDVIRKEDSQYEKPHQRVLVTVADYDGQYIIDLVNSNLSTCSFIESKWTDKQREVIKLIDTHTQGHIASKLGISKSSVYKRINASGYYTYQNSVGKIENLIARLWESISV